MKWIGVAAVVAALAFAAAGCGGSSDSNSEAAADTVATETSSSTDGMSTETTSTETTSTETTSTESTGNLTGECKDLLEAGEKFGAAIASSGSGTDADLSVTAAAFKEFAEKAPDELKDDFEALADVIVVYADALKEIDFKPGQAPTAAQIAKLARLSQSLNSEKVTKASAAIAAWGKTHCGTP